jgi:hypothetical protein
MSKVNGGWLINAKTIFESKVNLKSIASYMNNVAAIINKYYKAIGYGNISSEDIDVELSRALMDVTIGVPPQIKYRFNIDNIK